MCSMDGGGVLVEWEVNHLLLQQLEKDFKIKSEKDYYKLTTTDVKKKVCSFGEAN